MLLSCWKTVHLIKTATVVNEVHLSLESWPKYLDAEKPIKFKKLNNSIKYHRPNPARYTYNYEFIANNMYIPTLYVYTYYLPI